MENMDTTTDASKPSSKKPAAELDTVKVMKQIEDAQALAPQGNPKGALDALLVLEKQCRLAEDMALGQAVCTAILDVTQASGSWKELLDQITMLTKRRGQLKSTIQTIVRRATRVLDDVKDVDKQIELIKVLQAVTEGKIFVEIDRARLTKRLAKLYEDQGKISEAADSMQEMAVETFGAMHRSEKIAYVLNQMRLCMDNNDFTRAQILGRKVSPKAFAAGSKDQEAGEISLQGTAIEKPEEGTPDMAGLKHLYYTQMVRFHKQSNNYLEIVRCLLAMYAVVKGDSSRWPPVLKQAVWYLALCPAYSTSEGSASDYLTLLNTVSADPNLGEIPDHHDLLQMFITKEVTGAQALLSRYGAEIQSQAEVFGGADGKQRLEDLRTRITQHNIIVVGKYYAQLRMQRLATLLDLPAAEAEKHLSDMVVQKALHAKIDRPRGVVKFLSMKDSMQVLDKWGESISKLLGLVDTASQTIQKESMQHNVPIGVGL